MLRRPLGRSSEHCPTVPGSCFPDRLPGQSAEPARSACRIR
jgi:hypothetical protein